MKVNEDIGLSALPSGGDLMAHIKWDPWRSIGLLQNRINQIMSDSSTPDIDEEQIAGCEWKPAIDIFQNADGVIVIQADLPGVRKEDVTVELNGSLMTLKGERTTEFPVDPDKFYRRERCFGKFFRAFSLPDSVLPDHIKAALNNGVLEITLSKPEKEKPGLIQVTIN